MWLHPDQDYIFPRMDALFAKAAQRRQKNDDDDDGIRRLSCGEEEKEAEKTTTAVVRPIEASNQMEREAAWKAWFAFMSAKHFQADAKEQNASMEEVKNNATFLA